MLKQKAKVYSSAEGLTVVAPMPGLAAANVEVSLTGELLTIETNTDSLQRSELVALPRAVDGAAAMAVYAYGVLVVTMPLARSDGLHECGPVLAGLGSSRGMLATSGSPSPAAST